VSTKNPTPKPAQEPFERQVERLERLARFGTDLAAAMREEFGYYWLHPDRCRQVPQALPFVRRVDELRALAIRYGRTLAAVRAMPPVQALTAFRTLDGAALFAATQGLEATAQTLREAGRRLGWGSHAADRPALVASRAHRLAGGPASVPDPAAKVAGAKAVTGRLKAWLAAAEEAAMPAKPEAPPPPPSVGAKRLAAFAGSLALVLAVRDELAAPMAALRAARAGEAAPAGLGSALAAAVPPAAAEIAADAALRRAVDVALTQHAQFAARLPAFEDALARARAAPEAEASAVLAGHDLAALKGTMFPLTTLHLTFGDHPATASLFPRPDVVRVQASVPAKEPPAPMTPAPPAAPAPSGPPAAPAPAKPAPADWRAEAETRSRKRLALLMGFMRNPEDRSVFKDDATVYRLIAEETLHQQERERDRALQLRFLAGKGEAGEAAAERRARLEKELGEARAFLAQLGQLQKFVTARAAQAAPPPRQ
jgi:hypothetical protein